MQDDNKKTKRSKSGVSGHGRVRGELEHFWALQQDEGLVTQTALLARAVRPGVHAAVPDTAVAVEQGAPIARLRSRGQVPLPEGLNAVGGNAMRGVSVCDERLDLFSEIAKVALNFDVVLVRATGDEKVVVMLDVLKFMGDNDRLASLAVFEGCRVGPAWREGKSGLIFDCMIGRKTVLLP